MGRCMKSHVLVHLFYEVCLDVVHFLPPERDRVAEFFATVSGVCWQSGRTLSI